MTAAHEALEAGNPEKAVDLYLPLAQRGDLSAQHALGYVLTDKVNPRRPAEGTRWYKRAVQGGYAISAWNMAIEFRLRGQRRWYVHWLRTAAALGEEDAVIAAEKLPSLGKDWWKLDGVADPVGASRGFNASVVKLPRLDGE